MNTSARGIMSTFAEYGTLDRDAVVSEWERHRSGILFVIIIVCTVCIFGLLLKLVKWIEERQHQRADEESQEVDQPLKTVYDVTFPPTKDNTPVWKKLPKKLVLVFSGYAKGRQHQHHSQPIYRPPAETKLIIDVQE